MAKTEKKAATCEVKCLVKFRDKETNKIHKPGEIFKVTEERFEEILKVGKFVEKHISEEVAEKK